MPLSALLNRVIHEFRLADLPAFAEVVGCILHDSRQHCTAQWREGRIGEARDGNFHHRIRRELAVFRGVEGLLHMKDYIEAEGLSFGMASPKRYQQAMTGAGFKDVHTESRNAWYREEARRELNRLKTDLYDEAVRITSKAFVEKNLRTWTAMQKVLDSGEHCPTHLSATKPPA